MLAQVVSRVHAVAWSGRGSSGPQVCGTPDATFPVRIVAAKDLPPAKDTKQVCGKDASGCRLAFDLGKSDIKTVAVKDNQARSARRICDCPRLHRMTASIASLDAHRPSANAPRYHHPAVVPALTPLLRATHRSAVLLRRTRATSGSRAMSAKSLGYPGDGAIIFEHSAVS